MSPLGHRRLIQSFLNAIPSWSSRARAALASSSENRPVKRASVARSFRGQFQVALVRQNVESRRWTGGR